MANEIPVQPYIEVVGTAWAGSNGFATLTPQPEDLAYMGKFTRQNIARWMNSAGFHSPEWFSILPIEDFHAVYGDIEIPWATEAAKALWEKEYPESTWISRAPSFRLRRGV